MQSWTICNFITMLCLPLLLIACGRPVPLQLPSMPQTPKGEQFGQAQYSTSASKYAYACLRGVFIGEHVQGNTLGAPLYEQHSPGEHGKIYKYYLIEGEEGRKPYQFSTFGGNQYTFTVHTTDDGIVTHCAVTKTEGSRGAYIPPPPIVRHGKLR